MRRPLFAACLGFAALAALWLGVGEPPSGGAGAAAADITGQTPQEKEFVLVTGRVYRTEARESYGREMLNIYLDSVMILEKSSSPVKISYPWDLVCETSQSQRPLLGSKITITGQISYAKAATNEGEFDAAGYDRILGIGCHLKKAEVCDSSDEYSVIQEGLYRLRCYWKNRLYSCFPEKEASILCTMLLGDKTELDSEVRSLYKRNGIVHILSISGLHITLIGMGIYRLLRKAGAPVLLSAILGGTILILYGVMTGLGLSACRAIGMYLIRMLGLCLGRTYDMLTALGIMGVFMLLGQPEYLRHSGFLLSFGSVCAIGILLPALSGIWNGESPGGLHWLQRLPQLHGLGERLGNGLRQSFLAGLSVTLFTLPVQLCFYYEVPIYSVFLNMLILPFMGLIMTTGLAVMLVPWAGFLSSVVVLLLSGYETLCGFFDRLPFHTWTPGHPGTWQVVLFYALLAAAAAVGRYLMQKGSKRVISVGVSGLLLLAAVFLLGVRMNLGLSISFLDVGQGDCILVQTDGGEAYLFDGGSSDKSGVGRYIIAPFLKYHGIQRLDAVFVSHPDSDHISGILELLEPGNDCGITIDRLILPGVGENTSGALPVMGEGASGALPVMGEAVSEALPGLAVAALHRAGTKIGYMNSGDAWQSGLTRFLCLHPPQGFPTIDTNAYSQCFLVQYGDFSLLLTGDVEEEGERELGNQLISRDIRNVTVLKAAHHGSRNSTTEEILSQITPRLAIISCGQDNSYGHPHKELLERLRHTGSVILTTPEEGAIRIHIRNGRVRVTSFKGNLLNPA